MPTVDLVVETDVDRTTRVRQLGAMFDAPINEKLRREWHATLPLEERPWSIGLILGPSGSGKTQVLRRLFGDPLPLSWSQKAIVDDFSSSLEDTVAALSSVGFSTIPAWMRSFATLSNGEQFRASIARALLEDGRPVVPVDEFTSVVDRQVAKVASHAVARYVRKGQRRVAVASCHYDIIDWLQPDWVFEPATCAFQWRELQRRPSIDVVIGRCSRAHWGVFAPFHYMTAALNESAACFGLWIGYRLVAFAGVLPRPHPRVRDVYGISRLVTLPDFQGLGLAFVLSESVASAYSGAGLRFRTYPAHPALIRSFQRSNKWAQISEAGTFKSRALGPINKNGGAGSFGGRQNAVFEYVGPKLPKEQAVGFVARAAVDGSRRRAALRA